MDGLQIIENVAVMRENVLPFALPDLDRTEFDEIKGVLESNWITTGPKTRQFEAEFAAAVGAAHAIAVNSCTAAMHLALEACGLKAGDFVITTPYTFAATAEVVRYFNAIPVFVDIDPETLNLDISKLHHTLERTSRGQATLPGTPRLSPDDVHDRLKVAIPVHIGGLPVDLDALATVAHEYSLTIIEDAAHAFPATYKGRTIGAELAEGRPSAACFSFYATKTITTGEGGMICTNDPVLAERCRIMSLHGISKDAWKRYTAEGSWYYEIIAPGYKYNMTDVAAAMGLAQLRKAERMWLRRRQIAMRYNAAFEEQPELQIPADQSECQHAWHLYLLRLNLDQLKIDRGRFIEELKVRNIGTSVHFIPLHLHPYYRQTYGYQPEDFPVAYGEYQRVISLPIYSKMADQDINDVIDAVLDVVKRFGR
jgi:dTDP-4-amino-4,6-dideoxygalactose transaminase